MGVRDFTGRSAELRTLTRLLDEVDDRVPGTPLISIIAGTAGVGKTALAVHWAHQHAAGFPDGQLYAELQGFGPVGIPVDAVVVVRRFLDAFHVSPAHVPADADAQFSLYRSILAGKRVLIILDNVRDADQVRPLLPGTGGCLVVVTSRNELASLVALEGAVPLPVGLLAPGEARDLLARRLGAARVGREPAQADDLASLCARLPLALNIAAARAAARPVMTLRTLTARLRDARLDLLTAGPGHADVRAVFSWSYHALSTPAARMFRLLGLHPGPGISAHAAAALAGLDDGQTSVALDELINANLLEEHASGRYDLHDLLRDYAAEQARACDSEDEQRAAIRRVLDHYLLTAHTAALFFVRHDQLPHLLQTSAGVTGALLADAEQARAWCQAEQPVVTAAVSLAADTGFAAHAWQLACSIEALPEQWRRWQEQVTMSHIVLAAARQAGDQLGQAYAHRQLGRALSTGGRHAEASNHLQRALVLFSRYGDRISYAGTALTLAGDLGMLGQPAQALALSERSLEIYQTAGHRAGRVNALGAVGWYHLLLGSYEQGLAICQQAIQLEPLADDPSAKHMRAAVLDSIGYAHHHLGHHSAAAVSYREALLISQSTEQDKFQSMILDHLGDAYLAAANAAAACDAWAQALAIVNDLHNPCAGQLRAKIRDTNAYLQK
jgi:tetratricopeptide (TPR) repeat protein